MRMHNLLRLMLLISATPLFTQAADRKPNFLFIYTDDQRWDALGIVQREQGDRSRYPWFKTPHLDRLASEGVRFRNAFVTLPLCAPSRAVFLTGKYNHLNGIANNRTPFPGTNVTHATVLNSAGYRTAYIGKWHMGGQTGKRPGFHYSASFIGQGRYQDCAFEINGVPTPTSGWVDDVSTHYAIEFMRQNRDQPFSVVLGYKSCHGPTAPPERARTLFADVRARRVPNLTARAVYRSPAETGPAPVSSGEDTVPININYFRCLSATDENVGRLLQAIDDLKLAEDTVVIFTSDNGYYHGEHGLGDKRSAYDESLRIPLLLRYPRLVPKGMTVDQMVLNLDLAPTLLDLAGVPVPSQMQGRSWKPLLTGNATDWRKAFLFEYFWERQFPTTPTVVGIRTPGAKLIKYPGHDEWTELFDLAADPYELKNLATDPAKKELLTEMQAQFDREAKAVAFHIPDYADIPGPTNSPPFAQKAGKKKKKALFK